MLSPSPERATPEAIRKIEEYQRTDDHRRIATPNTF
jgi:hypothetical protein